MTPREILILCASRKMFDDSIDEKQVSSVVDDEARTANREIQRYYNDLSQRGLKMLDTAVLKRLRYLIALEAAKHQDHIYNYIEDKPRNVKRAIVNMWVYPMAEFLCNAFESYNEREEYIKYEREKFGVKNE